MKTALPLAAVLVALVAGGCATSAPKTTAPYLATLQQRGVDPGTYARISQGRVLTYDDIQNLVQRGIPGEKITDYLKATRAPYIFTAAQINRLAAAGAGSSLITFLRNPPAKPTLPPGYDNPTTQAFLNSPYWRDPYYMDPQPFAFAYPQSWSAPGALAGGPENPVLE